MSDDEGEDEERSFIRALTDALDRAEGVTDPRDVVLLRLRFASTEELVALIGVIEGDPREGWARARELRWAVEDAVHRHRALRLSTDALEAERARMARALGLEDGEDGGE